MSRGSTPVSLLRDWQYSDRETDESDPDPINVAKQLGIFEARCKVLSVDGFIIMSTELKHTFTAYILDFLKGPQVLFTGRCVHLFAMPDADDKEVIFEPLEHSKTFCFPKFWA